MDIYILLQVILIFLVQCPEKALGLPYASMNGLDVCDGDIESAYQQTPTSEIHYIFWGDEFPLEYQEKYPVIKRTLLGGNTAGYNYWKHIQSCMDHHGFKPCKADPDVWTKEIGKYRTLKKESVGPLKIYFGKKLSNVTLYDVVKAWIFVSYQYI